MIVSLNVLSLKYSLCLDCTVREKERSLYPSQFVLIRIATQLNLSVLPAQYTQNLPSVPRQPGQSLSKTSSFLVAVFLQHRKQNIRTFVIAMV